MLLEWSDALLSLVGERVSSYSVVTYAAITQPSLERLQVSLSQTAKNKEVGAGSRAWDSPFQDGSSPNRPDPSTIFLASFSPVNLTSLSAVFGAGRTVACQTTFQPGG